MQSQMPFLKVLHTLEPIQKDSAICETIAVRLIRTWVKHLFHFTWATSCATNFTIFPWSWTALYTVILTSLDRECGRNVGGRVLQQCFWHRLCCSVKLARFFFFLECRDAEEGSCPILTTLPHRVPWRAHLPTRQQLVLPASWNDLRASKIQNYGQQASWERQVGTAANT